ncbi:glycosyltransferase family 4 protein [Staphylococcus equorum]|uniref:glycosyltransferase family 4 protein n=1 Tax=Staphylococcus equorum TaxID=246432 RepID=UPI0018677E42|nr:glycosyltransferase family 4 protein [Staphylococcus equorum]MDK9855713.1 glycosyltransferase family 4 protein [Staphylococcus equorum]
MKNKKIFHLVTVSKSISLMKGQIEYLRNKGLDVHVVSSRGEELENYSSNITHVLNMEREVSLINDIKSLINMILLFLKEKPYIVNAGTPKAGLIGTLAGFITRRPVRIYTVRGLRLETVSGLKYRILYLMEKIAMFCATDILAISESLKNKIIFLNLEKEENIKVLGHGSSNGIMLDNFRQEFNEIPDEISRKIEGCFVLGFVGRIVKDKGIKEVIESFKIIKNKGYNVKLLVVGKVEKDNTISKEDFDFLNNDADVVLVGQVTNTVNYYNHMDVLVFPTYREGFGNVSIEAQAVKVPVITTNVTGAVDTVEDKLTGYIVAKGDYKGIAKRVEMLIKNPELKERLGNVARKKVEEKFNSIDIWEHLHSFYEEKF